MNLSFLYLAEFVRDWNRQRLTDLDLSALEDAIAREADAAPVIRGTGGLRKLRFAPPTRHRGKSGATRVGFSYVNVRSTIVVVAMFAKNESSNFSAADRAAIAKRLKIIEGTLR